ncbi:hypothetical protein ACNPMO_13110, partial [Enterococcus faecium]
IVIPPAIFFYYSTLFDSRFKTLQQNQQDHRPVKRRNKFYRSLRTASTTIKGMEAIRGLYKKTRKEGTLFGFSVCTEIKVLLGIPA